MGTTLANLTIRRLPINEAEKLIPDSLIRQFTPAWTTITSEHFEVGMMDKIGRKLSKKTESAVLSAELLDDDILILNVFRNGKNVANHISGSYYGYTKKTGNPAAFVKELELPENYIEYIKWALKCENLYKKIELLEKILGTPLWIDYRLISDSEIEYNITQQDLGYVEGYIKEKKASKKIRNAAKAKLLMEFDGKVYENLGSDMYHIQKPSSDGNYCESEGHFIYGISPEGKLEPLFDISSLYVNSYNKIIANKKAAAVLQILMTNFEIGEFTFLLFDLKGKLLGETVLPGRAGNPLLLFEDGGIICSSIEEQFIAEYGIDGSKKWELETGYLNVKPVFYDGYIYLYYTKRNTNKSELLKVNRNGEILASLDLKLYGGGHWYTFQFDEKGNFYFCLYVNNKGIESHKLFYIDGNLNIISELVLDDSSSDGVLDSGNNRLYILTFEKEILAVNTEKNLICARRKYEETSHFCLTDAKGRLVINTGMSTIEVFDPELNIISRHRLKGIITDIFNNSDGNACSITEQMPSDAFTKDNVKSTVRVYEII